ncbi:MAG: glycosyltransferase [Lachnospiraceae bacterium]|nr:glycosyltransferase [Lachnospiraceae bacterium]
MKKIMFHLNCLEQGGAERVVSNLANSFVREGIADVIIATEWEGKDEFKLDDRVRRIHVGLREDEENRSRFAKISLRKKHLKELVLKEKPDVVIAFAQKAIYRALSSLKKVDVPVIISIRTDPAGHYDSLIDTIEIARLFKRADGCVFQTEGQREFFPEHLQKKSVIILNPVNDKYINVPRPEKTTKTIVQSGRLVDFKNQPMLIDAFMKVHEKHPDYDLKIYGPDSFDGTKEILETKIKEYDADGFIHLMGGSDSLEKVLPECEIYAFSSDWEGLPNALLEAMALGMPIVATDCPCGGPRTVMTDGENGLLVPIKDPDSLAAGLIRLIEDKELAEKMGKNASKISEKINSNAIVAQWKEYIDEVIERYNVRN